MNFIDVGHAELALEMTYAYPKYPPPPHSHVLLAKPAVLTLHPYPLTS
jgi:hypothetical protein